MIKICKKCKIEKSIDEFSFCGNGYKRTKCKTCINEEQKIFRDNNPEYMAAAQKKYLSKDPKRIEQKNQKRKEYYKRNSDKARLDRMIYYWENREQEIEKNKKWKENNRQRIIEYRKKYNNEKPYVKRNSEAKRRASKKTTNVENIDIREIIKRDGTICWLCLKNCPPDNITLDHIVPLSRGGSHTYENIALAHRECNSKKFVNIVERGIFANDN